MAEDNNKNRLINNIGGYVIKVGDAFVATYQRSEFLLLTKNYPCLLTPNLSDVQEVLYNKDKAKEMAKKVNGSVYQICVKPLEDD